jgi:putative ABC transport system permease protein
MHTIQGIDMIGLFRISLKILISDRGKFSSLIVGISIAVFLMMQVTAIFSGVFHRLASNIINVGATVWVMDPDINMQENHIPMQNYMLDAVKSIRGVKYAAPLIINVQLMKLMNGHHQIVEVIGLDDMSLLGRPAMAAGNIKMIYNTNAYIGIENAEYEKLNNPVIGTTFEIDQHPGIIAGLGMKPVVGLYGMPTLYTTYSRAAAFLPLHSTLSYVLVEPKSREDIPYIKTRVQALGYLALTQQEFIDRNTSYYLFKTGIGTNLWILKVICFVIGLSVAGQTFYMFILENLTLFGALKAMGAKKNELISIILFQSLMTGTIGYGVGVLASSLFTTFAIFNLPNYTGLITYESMILSLCMVLIIIAFTSYLGIQKVTQIEPYDIFRS